VSVLAEYISTAPLERGHLQNIPEKKFIEVATEIFCGFCSTEPFQNAPRPNRRARDHSSASLTFRLFHRSSRRFLMSRRAAFSTVRKLKKTFSPARRARAYFR